MPGYSTYHSQLIRFFRLHKNINDFLFRAKFTYSKLVKRGYKHSLLLKYFRRFCSAYNIEGNMARKILIYSFRVCLNTTLLFPAIYMISIEEIDDIVKSGYVKITPLTCIYKSYFTYYHDDVIKWKNVSGPR